MLARRFALGVVAAACLSSVVGVRAQNAGEPIPHNQDQAPNPAKSPSEAIKAMTVPPGFTVELVAGEPDLLNPVAMTFDEKGRVWVTESFEYPRSEAGPGRDRIKVLEDTDGDGKMDKFTIFAEGLNIPSGIAVGGGGVWVANSPDILFLKDTDGDGRADLREVVVTGFGRDDTHELPNSLTWGPDGWLYGLNGVFNRSVVAYRGKTHDFTCALFRIHPRTRDFEVFAQGTSNPWGVAWDAEGSAFLSACVIDHLWHLVETGYYHRQGGPYPPFTWKIESIVGYKHQKAAYCGIHYFDSDAYPVEYRDKLYMGNVHGGCINVDGLVRNGASYRGVKVPDFLTANDAWFMPVSQKTGPDGSLYILDWYDRYHCYQDARRDPAGIDRLKGRLYRVRYKDTPRVHGFDLARETDAQLIHRLHDPNIYFRDVAQRLLQERNSPETRTKLESLVLRDSAPRKPRMHALWSLIGAGPLRTEFHRTLLAHADPGFRAWGVRAAGDMHEVEASIRDQIKALAHDPSHDVTLQVAIAAKKIGGLDPIPLFFEVLTTAADDPIIPQIVWQNAHPMLDRRDDADRFAERLSAVSLRSGDVGTSLLPRTVERLLSAQPPRIDLATRLTVHAIRLTMTDPGAIEVARQCMGQLASRVDSGEMTRDGIAGLREAIAPTLVSIATNGPESPLTVESNLLAAALGDPQALKTAVKFLNDPSRSARERLRSLNVLIAARHEGVLTAVRAILTAVNANSADFRGHVLSLLGRLDDPEIGELVLERFRTMEPELKPRAIELLSQRPSWSKALLRSISNGDIPKDALNLNQVRKLAVSKDTDLARSVRSIWGTIREGRNPGREAVIGQMRNLLLNNPGDPAAGQAVFRNVCAQCHKIYGEGQEVGPELTANGRASFEQLLSNVFDPSLVIGEAYQATSIATTDGRVLTGLQVENSPARVILKTQGGKVETIPRDHVEDVKLSSLSLMPEDLEKQLKPRELADLFAFLCLDRPPADPAARPLPGSPNGLWSRPAALRRP